MLQFNQHAEAYQRIRKKISYPEKLYSMLAGASDGHGFALDIGCGNGVSTIRLADHFDYVEGQDIGEKLIEAARLNYPGIAFSVCPSEELQSDRKYDLVTSATSFYWMNREVVLTKVADVLKPNGIFCAYKYDFPIVYGLARDVVENHLANRWSKHRDQRLTQYDDTLEKITASNRYQSAERFVLSNIIELSPLELALFFLSTSYVTRYMELEGGQDYADHLIHRICEADSSGRLYVNFDIHGFIAKSNG